MAFQKQTISPWALAIMAIPLLVLTGTELILGFWGDSGVSVPTELIENPARVELAARYNAMAAFVFFTTVALAVTAIFVWDVYWRFSNGSKVRVVVTLLLVVLVTLVFSVLEPEEMKSFETYQLLGEDLFREALGAAKTGACLPDRATCSTGSGFDAMVHLVDLSNQIVSLAAACSLLGIVLALGQMPGASDDVEDLADQLRDARRVSKRYLYCSGTLLTAGMLWVQSWMSWPTTLIADDAARAEFAGLVNAFSLFRGTTFSLLILSVYLPVHLGLAHRFDSFWDEVPRDADMAKDESLARINYVDSLKAITAIVAPILMGVIGSSWSVSLGF